MAARDIAGSTARTASGTTYTIDISTAAVGADCFMWAGHGTSSATFTLPSWTQIATLTTASTATGTLWYRRKQTGDTTFTLTASASGKGAASWVTFTGLDATTPYETAQSTYLLAKNGSSTNVNTPSVACPDAQAWALGMFLSRSSTSGNKNITFTISTLTEQVDINNSAATSSIWIGVMMADSEAAVGDTNSHSYTATASFAETYGVGGLLYLHPASSGVSGAAALAATATLGASSTTSRVAAADLAATASLSSAPTVSRVAAADLTAGASLGAAATITPGGAVSGAAALVATGALAAVATVTVGGAAPLVATASMSASSTTSRVGAVALSATGALAATSTTSRVAAVALVAQGALVANAGGVQTGATALSATGALAAAVTLSRVAGASLTASGSLTASAVVSRVAAVALAATAALGPTAVITKPAASNLVAMAVLVVAAQVTASYIAPTPSGRGLYVGREWRGIIVPTETRGIIASRA